MKKLNITSPIKIKIIQRAIDKMDRIGTDGVAQLLGKGRKDKSGDFTIGADLTKLQIKTLMEALSGQIQPENTEGWNDVGSI